MRAVIALSIALAVVATSGCTAVTNAGAYEVRETLDLRLEGFEGYADMRLFFWVTDDSNEAVFVGIVNGLSADGDGIGVVEIPIPFLLDHNGTYFVSVLPQPRDSLVPMSGSGWTVPVDDASALIRGSDPTGSVDVPERPPGPGGFSYHLRLFSPHVPMPTDLPTMPGHAYVVEVIDTESSRPVGYHRLDEILTNDFDVGVPFVIRPGRSYTVESYVDVDRSGDYSGQPLDHSWSERGDSAPGGLDAMFIHNSMFEDLQFIPEG